MFYRHLHAPECELSIHGEEAPRSMEAQLQEALHAKDAEIAALREQLRLDSIEIEGVRERNES